MIQQTAGSGPGAEPQEPFQDELTPGVRELPTNLREIVQRSIELRRENQDLKERMDANTAELKRLDPMILERFTQRQIRQQKMMTGETVWIEKTVYASLVRDEDGEHEGDHRALRQHGLAWLVKDRVNDKSLSAWVREQQKQETEIPEELLPWLKISEIYRVKVRT